MTDPGQTALLQDTIVAPATIPGTGAISIVRISGPETFRIVDATVQLKSGYISQAKAYTIHFAKVFTGGVLLDEVLVSVFRAPHSYTGEDAVEISTHASSFIVSELIRLLIQAGARMAEPGEFTRRAFLNGKMDLSQAEAVADVISASNEASHRIAINQLKGRYSEELESLHAELLEMASLLELELDFSEEDVEFADREKLLELVRETLAHVRKLAGSFQQGNMIKNGIPVAIVGEVNAGKSSLLNTLVGEDRAIVSDIPGTTRDTIEELLQINGVSFRLIDTAGIRESEDKIERIGIEKTLLKIDRAEVIIGVLDTTDGLGKIKEKIELISGKIESGKQTLIFLLNKVDLLSKHDINNFVIVSNQIVSSLDNKVFVIPVSAKTGFGIEDLRKALFKVKKTLFGEDSDTIVTSLRHYQSLTRCAAALERTETALLSFLPTDLAAEDLREAIACVNLILGKDLGLSPEQVLNNIFANHCIGK